MVSNLPKEDTMKKLALVLLLVAVSCNAHALSYFGFEDYGGVWYDADKSGGDSNMCWAASLSNVLAYTGWDAGMGADGIFSDYRSHFGNVASYHAAGVEYWRSTYYPGSAIPQDRETFLTSSDMMSNIDFWLHAGYGLNGAFILPSGMAHAMTIYGVEYGDGDYSGLWVVDSNDGIDRLIYLPMSLEDTGLFNPVWVVDSGSYAGWWLNTVNALGQNIAPVPEPGTMLLVLTILPLYAARRKRALC